MPTVTIHYQSPANDPLKVPRPHRYTLDGSDADHMPVCVGGEIGKVKLLGFCLTEKPDVDDWALSSPSDVGDPGYVPEEMAGFYAQFYDVATGDMFGYAVPIKKVEVAP